MANARKYPTEIKILSPTAILGYGFPESSFEAGLERYPSVKDE